MISKPLKYHGSKHYLAPWIISNMPYHKLYLEPYFGSGSVLFRKPFDNISETVNDIYGDLMNFWSCLRHKELYDELVRILSFTPFSDRIFELSYKNVESWMPQDVNNLVKSAVNLFVKFRQSRQGLGKCYATPTSRTRRRMHEHISAWLSAIDGMYDCHVRLQKVELRCMDGPKFIQTYDDELALFYCDPTYLAVDEDGTPIRVTTDDYEYEMSIDDHIKLLDTLSKISGKFILSGYHSKLYQRYADTYSWRCVTKEIDNKASSKKVKDIRVECLWMNY